MITRLTLALLLVTTIALKAEQEFLALPGSEIILQVPDGWTIKDKNGELGMYSLDQPKKGLPSRIHLSVLANNSTTLESAIETEIDRITERSPKWGSTNDRRSFRGSRPITTDSGMNGLCADFYYDEPAGRRYTIIKYYFFDEHGRIFRACAHVGGNETRFRDYEQAILRGLTLNKLKNG